MPTPTQHLNNNLFLAFESYSASSYTDAWHEDAACIDITITRDAATHAVPLAYAA